MEQKQELPCESAWKKKKKTEERWIKWESERMEQNMAFRHGQYTLEMMWMQKPEQLNARLPWQIVMNCHMTQAI